MKRLLAACLFLIPVDAVRADQASDISACRSFKSDAARLACYDGIPISAPAKISSGGTISWADLNVDYKELRGKTVTTSGYFVIMGDQGILYESSNDLGMNALFLDVERVPREQRRDLFKHCSNGCDATVSGKVGDILMQRGITAKSIMVE